MQYLKKDGTKVDGLPDPEEYVKDEPEATVETVYTVDLFDDEGKRIATEHIGLKYPNKETIKWCILKHNASYAKANRTYSLSY